MIIKKPVLSNGRVIGHRVYENSATESYAFKRYEWLEDKPPEICKEIEAENKAAVIIANLKAANARLAIYNERKAHGKI